MADMKNDRLLEKLIEHSKTIGGMNVAFTAERYIVSLIDFVSDSTQYDISEGEKGALAGMLTKLLPSAGENYADIKNFILERVTGGNGDFIDGIYMQQHIYKARERAKERGLEALTPGVLLESIVSDPSDFIKKVIAKGQKADSGDDSDDDMAALFEGLLSTSFEDYVSGGKKSGTGTETTASAETGLDDDTIDEEDDVIWDGLDDVDDAAESPKMAVAKLTEKVKSTHDLLKETIYGQDNAISVFTTGYFQAELLAMTDKSRVKPRATFLFAGPPGVGKTFLAETAANVLGLPFMRFDMSEYSDKEANIEFCGSDRVYKGAKEGNVTSFVAKNSKCVLLFDEIEKAHINVIHLFLQMLDAGRLRDNYTDKEVSFTDAIIIFTTNAGKQLYDTPDAGDFSGVSRKVILNALQNDIREDTGVPFFPPALCSRFASGNVVMFNHMTAHNLRAIARKEVLRHAKNFEGEIGIDVDIDEQVYTALLFAEGGSADARTIKSRAETFFDGELFELFRLMASGNSSGGIENIEKIRMGVELPKADADIMALFTDSERQEVLVFADEATVNDCRELCGDVTFTGAQTIDTANELLRERDVSFILIDLGYGCPEERQYLNVEDVDSAARDFFWFVRERYPEIPIYILQHPGKGLKAEEEISFLRQGVRGVMELTEDGGAFAEGIRTVAEMIHQQRSMAELARSNKLVTFETAQSLSPDGRTAEIKLFDFEMAVAIDAEDKKNILSSVSKPDVTFDEVIGAEDAKKELRYFVEYLKNPRRFRGTGVSAPRGVLLYGPPGTGKTMLAKAMARESDVTFITAEGNQFLKKYVGEGPENVHELFRTARKYAPAILFVDEIDAIARDRRSGDRAEGVDATLTAFLTEMDGFNIDSTKPVFVLAATNFDVEPGGEKSLDPALMRRFDRRVYIDLPKREERVRYLRLRFQGNKAFEISDAEVENIAIRSTGMSLAELASIMELSLRTAIRDGGLKVTDAIFEEAFETFVSGEEKKWDISLLQRTARHEAGHAFLCWKSGETPSYLTIVARANHGGYMQHGDNEGKALYTKDELLARIRTSLGGRASEIVYYGDRDGISTGASGDLENATNVARRIICTYGMDEEFGLAVIDQQAARNSELTGRVRDAVNKILAQEMENAIALISANRPAIDAIVEELMRNNHLTGDEIAAIFTKACGGQEK